MTQKIPRPRGISVIRTEYIDAYHGAIKATRIPHSGYIFFVKRAPVK